MITSVAGTLEEKRAGLEPWETSASLWPGFATPPDPACLWGSS